MKVKTRELRLADTVNLGDYPFSYGVVTQIKDDEITIFRPYATTADFSYTGGVIPYIGVEEVILWLKSDREVEVLERKELK